MNNGAPGNVVTQQGFVVSDAIRPEYTDEELKNEQAIMDKLTEERNEQYNELIESIITGSDGKATFKSDIPLTDKVNHSQRMIVSIVK